MLKSQQLKEVPYPSDFSDIEKIEYDNLYAQAKILHSEVERTDSFIIHFSILMHIRSRRADFDNTPISDEELEQLRNSYKLTTKEFTTEIPPDHYCYDKENNPIYFPSTVTITDGTSNVVISSPAPDNTDKLICNDIVE
jgi:hypothetical protein